MGAVDNKIFHIQLVVFRLNEGRLELLINIVYLFWVLHFVTCIFPGITAGRLE